MSHLSHYVLAAGLLICGSAQGQDGALLEEDFSLGLVPPPGWAEFNNGASLGWESLNGRAHHDDWRGANDNRLLSPALDFTGLTQAGLHGTHGQVFARYRAQNEVQITLDGGLSYTTVLSISGDEDGQDFPLEIDLSAWVGQPQVQIAFHYQGDFANVWSLDDLRVDEVAPPPVYRWPELPTQFVPADGFCERFDGLAGSVPDHLAVNRLDVGSRQFDAEAWCNVGQLAPSLIAFSGLTSLEMGLDPSSSNFHQVSNALIVGLDGSTQSNFALEFMAWQAGEELQEDDGVFVSVDGVQWVQLETDWVFLTGGEVYAKRWRKVTTDLSRSGLDLSGNYYLAIGQSDDFPFGGQDGLAVDDLCIGGDVVAFQLNISNAVPGETARVEVTGADPDSFVVFLYSKVGPGPLDTAYGVASLSNPVLTMATLDADRNGRAGFALPLSANLNGRTIWAQGLELLGGQGRYTNLVEVVFP